MQAEIIMIGTELLLGQVQDTNATFMAQVLAENGINLFWKTTVGDNRARILEALDRALDRADVVLCSGGLGPTEDDITRECVAELLNRPLEYHEELFQAILQRFAHARAKITDNNKKQAQLPQGATAISNPHGTAPGILVEDARGIIFCMPGVPSELKPMLTDEIIPYLRRRFGIAGVLHYRVLKVCGMGESRVDSLIGDLINAHSNPTLGLLASLDAVRIRIAARAETIEAANALIDPVEAAVRERLGGLIMGKDDDTLEDVVNQLLCERGWTLAVLETETGGALSQRLTAIHAASFAGARVIPRPNLGGGSPEDFGLDFAQRLLVEFKATCVLALVADNEAHRTAAVFVSPEGTKRWDIGYYGNAGRNQLRTSVVALEGVRRCLNGLELVQ